MVAKTDLAALEHRLGEREFVLRLETEAKLCVGKGKGQGRGLFRLETKMDFYGCIRRCIQLSGLWGRAVRNYLDIQVVRNEVFLANLPKAFDGFRLLQLTDLHADLHPDFPEAVKQVIAPLAYDCLVLTGDYRTATYGDHSGATEATINIVSGVTAPKYAILGNHDCLAKVPAMEVAGIRFLLNEHVLIERDGAAISLIGIDDPHYYQSHSFERSMAGIPAECVKILLSHAPQTYCAAAERSIDLMLCGHTHGGQICLPGGYILMHDRTSPRHVLSGSWTEGALQGYTSRGTGASGLPARFNCPAEVTLHTLRRASA